jgi:hypothetical protein
MATPTTTSPRPHHLLLCCLLCAALLTWGCNEDSGGPVIPEDVDSSGSSSGTDCDALDDTCYGTSGATECFTEDCADDAPTVPIPPEMPYSNFCGGWQVMEGADYVHLSASAPALMSNGKSAALGYTLLAGPALLFSRGGFGVSLGLCGDDVIDPGELCDGLNTSGLACENLGFLSGQLRCDDACLNLDLTGCFDASALCAAGQLSESKGLHCRPGFIVDKTCYERGFDNFDEISCGEGCQWDTSACAFAPLASVAATTARACAVTSTPAPGQVVCWGEDPLGLSAPTDAAGSLHPPMRSAMPGERFTCGVREDTGHVHCWGDDLPSCGGDCNPSAQPSELQVTRDGYCARDGSALHCASNSSGAPFLGLSNLLSPFQLAGSLSDFALSPTYLCAAGMVGGQSQLACLRRQTGTNQLSIPLPLGSDARQLAVGDNTVCALNNEGEIDCMMMLLGANLTLSPSSRESRYSFSALAMHGNTVCGYSATSGRVLCWDALFEPVGANAPTVIPLHDQPTFAWGLAVGRDFACVEASEGVRCAKIPRPGPIISYSGGAFAPGMRALSAPSLSVTAQAAGIVGTGCALIYDPIKDPQGLQAQAHCWGPAFERFPWETAPWRALSVGSAQDLCLVSDSGTLTCTMQGAATTPWVLDDLNLRQVALGAGVGCGLNAAGLARCWDRNRGAPPPTFQAPPADARFAKLVLVGEEWCGILEGGEVPGVGPLRCSDRLAARYGVGAAGSRSYVRDVAMADDYLCTVGAAGWISCYGAGKPNGELPNNEWPFKSVAVAPGFACGLRFSGDVKCWGDVPQPLLDSTRRSVEVVGLSGGALGVCVHRKNGEFACWGDIALGYR